MILASSTAARAPSVATRTMPATSKSRRWIIESAFRLRVNYVGSALRPREMRIGVRIIQKPFSLGIPSQFSLGFHRDVMDQAGGACSMAHFRRRNRLLSRSHTLEPISVLLFALVQMNLVRADH